VLEAGQRHGAPRGDIYGCLYFYLQEQLRAFAERLSRFKVSFDIFCKDARELSKDISSGKLSSITPSSVVFDRIEVSNICDTEYVGIPDVLANWAPFLRRSDDAAIVGCLTNWAPKQPGAVAHNCDDKVISCITDKMIKDGRVCMGYGPQSRAHLWLTGLFR
jgi:hypothetical protein